MDVTAMRVGMAVIMSVMVMRVAAVIVGHRDRLSLCRLHPLAA
jgi:hypothetical protein